MNIMGFDLTLIIPTNDNITNLLGNSEIHLDRDGDFFLHLIDKIKGKRHRVNKIEGRHYYDEEKEIFRYGPMTEDNYGLPLHYVKARELADVFENYTSEYPLNRATGAFLKTLPKDYPIVLYWH